MPWKRRTRCDALAILHLGKVAAVGKPAQLKDGLLSAQASMSSRITAGAPYKRKEIIVTSAKPDAQLIASAESSAFLDFMTARPSPRWSC